VVGRRPRAYPCRSTSDALVDPILYVLALLQSFDALLDAPKPLVPIALLTWIRIGVEALSGRAEARRSGARGKSAESWFSLGALQRNHPNAGS
jgi:hypothetical protein